MRKAIAALLAATLGFFIACPAWGFGEIDAVVVKYRDDAPAADGAAQLSFTAQSRIAQALQSGFVLTGRTSDGAYRFELHPSLAPDAARAALNRIRLDGTVLYANQDGRSAGTPPATARATAKALSAAPGTDQLIIKYRDQKLAASAQAGAPPSAAQIDAIANVIGQPIAFVRVTGGGEYVVALFRAVAAEEAAAMAALLAQRPDVEYAEADARMSYLLTPNDPLYTSQWSAYDAVVGVNMPAAWNLTTGSANVYVGVIDTGILPHPDLVGRYIGGYDFIGSTLISGDGDGRDADATDPGDFVSQADINAGLDCGSASSSWHGTHVAGTIGATANNNFGVAGINWVSKIVPLRVLGKCFGYTSDIADAIRWGAGLAVTNVPANPYPARVLNLSLGGTGACGATFQNAINAALAAPGGGAVIAIAAGNSGGDASNNSPGNCNGVITVAATQSNGARASYSNYGGAVEIAAPGSGILSTLNNGTTFANGNGYNFVYYSGTSMATPHVAGIASLMLSVNPGLTAAQVLAKIQTSARPFLTGTGSDCTTSICGAGMIDAGAAVAAALPSGTTSTTIATSGTPSTLGASVTFTAAVTGTNPTGTVSFTDGGTSISGCATQALAGAGNVRTATCTTSALAVGTHSIVASYGGDGGNTASSSIALAQVVNSTAMGINVALASTGAVASASSTYSAAYPVTAVNNGDRAGVNSGPNGYWNDATPNALPDSVQIVFNGSKTINRVVVYSVQDNYLSPVEPSDTQTFTLYGLPAFIVEGWNGAAWVTLGTVTGNNLVKRTVTFTAFTTDRIRVTVTGTTDQWSRITEVEAFGTAATTNPTTTNVATSGTPSTLGASVTFTATVTGTNPTGTVNFTDGGTSISGCATQALGGTGNSRTATCSTTALPVGTHTIAAVYSGDGSNGASSSSGLTQVVVNGSATGTNVALASAGAVASASSSYSAGYPAAAINNGDRAGLNAGSGGFWNDATANALPDSVQIVFSGSKTIDRVVVYSVQDSYLSPVEPSDTQTFTLYGLPAFTVEGWNGTAWVTLATVGGNNLVKRTVSFAAFTTDRIRITVTGTTDQWSRIAEVEAFSAVAAPTGTNVALASAGGVATASSSYSAAYPVAAINNGDRAGLNAGNGGFWNDATANALPDTVQIGFNGSKTIDRVVLYTLQDNYASPVEPTDAMTFSTYGITGFTVEGWNGTTWVTLGTVAGNNLVKRTVTFAPFTTDRIRVTITGTVDQWSRITEVEAFGTDAGTGTNVALASAGAVASTSSSYSAGYPAAAINNGDRAGLNAGSGGFWNDATANALPDTAQIIFNGSKTIDRVVVYSVQDNYLSPVDPSDTQTFTLYGLPAFTVEGWNGTAWVTLGTVTGNNLVKRTVSFAAFTTDRIRVTITGTVDQWSRIAEIEAFGT